MKFSETFWRPFSEWSGCGFARLFRLSEETRILVGVRTMIISVVLVGWFLAFVANQPTKVIAISIAAAYVAWRWFIRLWLFGRYRCGVCGGVRCGKPEEGAVFNGLPVEPVCAKRLQASVAKYRDAHDEIAQIRSFQRKRVRREIVAFRQGLGVNADSMLPEALVPVSAAMRRQMDARDHTPVGG